MKCKDEEIANLLHQNITENEKFTDIIKNIFESNLTTLELIGFKKIKIIKDDFNP